MKKWSALAGVPVIKNILLLEKVYVTSVDAHEKAKLPQLSPMLFITINNLILLQYNTVTEKVTLSSIMWKQNYLQLLHILCCLELLIFVCIFSIKLT